MPDAPDLDIMSVEPRGFGVFGFYSFLFPLSSPDNNLYPTLTQHAIEAGSF
jgi:hypothetical protein